MFGVEGWCQATPPHTPTKEKPTLCRVCFGFPLRGVSEREPFPATLPAPTLWGLQGAPGPVSTLAHRAPGPLPYFLRRKEKVPAPATRSAQSLPSSLCSLLKDSFQTPAHTKPWGLLLSPPKGSSDRLHPVAVTFKIAAIVHQRGCQQRCLQKDSGVLKSHQLHKNRDFFFLK